MCQECISFKAFVTLTKHVGMVSKAGLYMQLLYLGLQRG